MIRGKRFIVFFSGGGGDVNDGGSINSWCGRWEYC